MKRQFAVGTAVLAAAALLAPAAGAKTERLSFYEVAGPMQFYNAAGQPITLNPPATLPAAGDSFDVTDTDYAGTYKHHAKQWTASDHLACSFVSTDSGTCDFQLAVGSSLVVLNRVPVQFHDTTFVARISEGTGNFKGARGTVTISNLPNGNSNLVVKVS